MIRCDTRIVGVKVVWLPILLVLLASCSGGSSSSSDAGDQTTNPSPDPNPDPNAAPTISLLADEEVVEPGASITLTWTVRNADSCSATGGWSGDRAASGSEIVGPLSVNTTYKLTCSGVGGNALVMITVFVNGVVQLSWIAPTENMDGSNLNDLVGYKIYYGVQSRGYVDSVRVNGSNVTQYELNIPMGTYYVAMTAMDAEGNESMFSNELVKDSI